MCLQKLFYFLIITIFYISFGHFSISDAHPIKHQDIHSHIVPGSILPPVFGGTWTVDSRLNLFSVEPHAYFISHRDNFHFREFYNLDAPFFTPLIVPGRPNLPPGAPGANLFPKTWTFSVKNEGCADFDYTDKWTIDVDPNVEVNNDKVSVGLKVGKGPVELSFNWEPGAMPPKTKFLFTPLANELMIEFSTTDTGQGFFGSGGSVSVTGQIHAKREGTGKVFAENDHYASGKGFLVSNFTWAQRDAAGSTAIVSTNVFDDYTCTKPTPEPSTLILLGTGLAGLLGLRRKGLFRKAERQ
ncbi:MAG TPA: PEP-CTERM sorting domain-containing protein [Candidatus Hypogeohydataceae bacterium YC41]